MVGTGATSLALNLASASSLAGSWVVVVGLPELGLAAAAEAGIDLRRLALVAAPEPGRWAAVVAALVGGVDLIVVDGRAPLGQGEGRRLASRVARAGLGARAGHAGLHRSGPPARGLAVRRHPLGGPGPVGGPG